MVLFFAAAVLVVAGFSRPVENLFRDLLISSVSPFIDPGQDIVIVATTEETLAGLPYRSPVDREFLAKLIEHVGEAGPKAVGIDILFDQATEQAKDGLLERVLENAPFPVVIASAENADGLTDSQVTYLKKFAPSVPRGLASLARDPLDGVVRGLFSGRENGGVWRPSFVGAVAAAGGVSPSAIRSDLAYFRTQHATPYDFPIYPAHLARVLPVQWFTDKYVLIGADLPLDDRHPTPFAALNGVKAGTLPGVVIHAHALAQLLTGGQIVQAGALSVGLFVATGALIAGWFAWRPLPVLVKPLILLGLIVSIFAGAATFFSRMGVLVPAVWPSVLVTGIFSIVALMAWHRDNDERRFIRHAFAQYVSPAIVETIIRDPASLRLGGERRTITCVFSDLEGFTGLSENQPPERIAELLNGYLDLVCDQFVKHGATIDKVVGDSVVGFFGAPAMQEDQAERAVSLALELDTLAQAYRVEVAQGRAQLGVTRIGIHSGPAVVGNFGGKRFFDYTAIGDTVNTTSRLEGANKFLGTRICVSVNVVDAAPSFLFRPAAVLYLAGKAQGIKVFEPLNAGAPEVAYVDEYREAYNLMMCGEPSAGEAFARIVAQHSNDRLAAIHSTRLASGALGADIHLSSK